MQTIIETGIKTNVLLHFLECDELKKFYSETEGLYEQHYGEWCQPTCPPSNPPPSFCGPIQNPPPRVTILTNSKIQKFKNS